MGEISTAHLELRCALNLDVYGVLGMGLIHSDRVVCQMQFSAKYADWNLLRQTRWQSYSGGRNNLKCCVTELAEPKNHNFVQDGSLNLYLGQNRDDIFKMYFIDQNDIYVLGMSEGIRSAYIGCCVFMSFVCKDPLKTVLM